jgi:acyl-CoA thioester hydrolase
MVNPQVLPSTALTTKRQPVSSQDWFEYPVKVHPHHTDYSGSVWHGTYLTWMEETRVEALRSLGIEYADLVALGCELPVVDLSIRYHRALKMGAEAIVRARMMEMQGVRINWEYQIQSIDRSITHVTAQVTLVAVDIEKGKILRQLPAEVKDALARRPQG